MPKPAARMGADSIALTHELISSRFPRSLPERPMVGPRLSEAEIEASLDAFLEANQGRDIWLFGYGSLMWNGELDAAERRLATVRGYHRRFCLWQWWSRGCEQRPNLMLALDRGGRCTGVAFRLAGPDPRTKVGAVWRRELLGDGYRPRQVTVATDAGDVRAVAFVANHGTERYAGSLPDELVADHIAAACGQNGPGAEYLLKTVHALAELGVRDGTLWRLQHLVAERLAKPATTV